MPGQITFTDDLNLVLCQIEHATDDSQLIVTLRRLAAICANREDGPELLEGFRDAYFREASNVRYREQLRVVMRERN